MIVTVYNPTTGRYVTTLNASAGAKKQVSTAAIKSKEGGQAAPLTPVASSVKVTLSAAAKAVLSGTTKLKASELFAKMQEPGYSASDLSGMTLYLDGGLKDLLPPAVPGSNKFFDPTKILSSKAKEISLSMADMGLNPLEFKTYKDGDDPTSIAWWGLDKDGKWNAITDANFKTSFDKNGQVLIDYSSLPSNIKAYKSIRADFSRVPNYEKLLSLLTAQGGRKLMDIRGNNDGPVVLDEATFKDIQKDMRNPTLSKAGASKITEVIVSGDVQGTKPIILTGKPGDVVRWFKQADDPNVAGADLLGWEEVRDTRTPAPTPIVIGPDGTAALKVTDLPADLQASAKIKAEVHSSALLDVVGNVTIDLPITKDSNGEERPVGQDMNPAIFARFRQMIDTNQASKTTIAGQSGPRTFTPDLVTQLGPKTLSCYAGDITIDATSESLLTPENWENLRVLNNYRSVAINLDMGVPSTRVPDENLSNAVSRLSYQQFIGGFSLFNSLSVKPSPIALVPSNYNSVTRTQNVQVSGLFLNGDTVQISLLSPKTGNMQDVNIGPISVSKGVSPEEQAKAFKGAFEAALKLPANSDLSGISIRRKDNSNELQLTWPPTQPDGKPSLATPVAVRTISDSKLVAGTYDARNRTQSIAVTEGFQSGDEFNMTLTNSDGVPVDLHIGPLAGGADKGKQITDLVAKIQSAADLKPALNVKAIAVGDPPSSLALQWSNAGPAGIPPISFSGSVRAQQDALTFGANLFNVPPSAVESLTSYPQVTGLEVSGTNDQILNNTDKLTKLISNGFIKSVGLVASGTGQLLLTAAQAVRAIPILEKLIPGANAAGLVSITDKRSAPSSYSNFTDAAASRLRGGIQLSGSASEISNALKGIGALTRTGKISSVTLTGANGSQTVFDNFNAAKLSALTARLRKTG